MTEGKVLQSCETSVSPAVETAHAHRTLASAKFVSVRPPSFVTTLTRCRCSLLAPAGAHYVPAAVQYQLLWHARRVQEQDVQARLTVLLGRVRLFGGHPLRPWPLCSNGCVASALPLHCSCSVASLQKPSCISLRYLVRAEATQNLYPGLSEYERPCLWKLEPDADAFSMHMQCADRCTQAEQERAHFSLTTKQLPADCGALGQECCIDEETETPFCNAGGSVCEGQTCVGSPSPPLHFNLLVLCSCCAGNSGLCSVAANVDSCMWDGCGQS